MNLNSVLLLMMEASEYFYYHSVNNKNMIASLLPTHVGAY